GADSDTLRGDGDFGVGSDTLYGDAGQDSLVGGGGDDHLYGDDDSDLLDGSDGNDQMFGGDAVDHLRGGYGNDTLDGGAGNDTFYELEGSNGDVYGGDDILYGGAGNDTVIYRPDNVISIISGTFGIDQTIVVDAGDAGKDTLIGIETMFNTGVFTPFDDVVTAQSALTGDALAGA